MKPTRFNMSAESHKALALKWALIGFACSGRGFNGDNYDREKHPALEGLLLSYFDGVYGTERESDFNEADPTRVARRTARSITRG